MTIDQLCRDFQNSVRRQQEYFDTQMEKKDETICVLTEQVEDLQAQVEKYKKIAQTHEEKVWELEGRLDLIKHRLACMVEYIDRKR